jgi:hypothetical protein
MIYWIAKVRLNLVCSLETSLRATHRQAKSCLSCYPVRFFQRAKVL